MFPVEIAIAAIAVPWMRGTGSGYGERTRIPTAKSASHTSASRKRTIESSLGAAMLLDSLDCKTLVDSPSAPWCTQECKVPLPWFCRLQSHSTFRWKLVPGSLLPFLVAG